MDVSKRGEEMLVSGSDDGYIGVSKRIVCVNGERSTDRRVDMGSKTERSD